MYFYCNQQRRKSQISLAWASWSTLLYGSRFQLLLCYVMLCYVIWLFVKRLSQEAIQRRSQRDRLVKIKVFKLRRDAEDIPCNITLRSAGGESFHSAGPTTAKARFWDREVRDQGIRRSQRSAERSGREEQADCGLYMSSHRYFGARPCCDLATRSRTLYLTRAKIGSQCSSLIMYSEIGK